MILKITIPIAPVPASRPRVTRFGTYYGKRYKAFKKEMKELIPGLMPDFYLQGRGGLRVNISLYCRKPKKPANEYPVGDIDNYAKAVLDSFNGILWVDDSQIVELFATKEYSDTPRIELEIDQ